MHPIYSLTRSLSENRVRSEGSPFRVRFFHDFRRIVVLFRENQGEIWPKWAFRSRSSILGQAPRYSGLLWIAILSLVAGCSTQEFQTPISIPVVKNVPDTEIKQTKMQVTNNDSLDKLVSILRYERFIHGLQTEDLELERDLLETSMNTATDAALIKLALLYSHKNSSFYNIVLAQSILQSCLNNSGGMHTEVTSLSNLISELLIEMIEQQKRLKTMRNELNTERSQRKTLKKQLDALKAIEESINQRSHHLSLSIRQ